MKEAIIRNRCGGLVCYCPKSEVPKKTLKDAIEWGYSIEEI